MANSYFCTPEDCEAVVLDHIDEIRGQIAREGREGLYMAIVNPTLTIEAVDGYAFEEAWPSIFLWEASVGKVPEGSPIIENARLKAIEAHRHRETLSAVWANRPAVLRGGAIAWYGGVYLHGIAGGVSGLSETADEMICYDYLLKPLSARVAANAVWPSQQSRIAKIREWGGRLPESK